MMKNILILLIIPIFAFMLCGCEKKDLVEDHDQNTYVKENLEESDDFIMKTEFEEYTTEDEKVEILFEKKDGSEFSFYLPFDLYKFVDDEWVLVPFKSDYKFNISEYFANKNESSENESAIGFEYIIFKNFNEEITVGRYKVVKELENQKVSCEFVIK